MSPRKKVKVEIAQEFPESWRWILEQNVAFYQRLSHFERQRFEELVQKFLKGASFVPVGDVVINERFKVMVAATAVMLVFRRSDLPIPPVRKIYVHPDSFFWGRDREKYGGMTENANTVHLSMRDFYYSFEKANDGYMLPIHEFAHVLDIMDGKFDGVPVKLPAELVKPFIECIRRDLELTRSGGGVLSKYGSKNEVELFAVAVENFFERPEELRKNHPELFDFLNKYFTG